MDKFQHFIKQLVKQKGYRCQAIIQFGSGKAKKYPDLSDYDLLIISKNAKDISIIRQTAQQLEQQIFKVKDGSVIGFLEKYAFVKPKFTGVHLVVVAQSEFNSEFRPLSWRLKLASLIFGGNFFLNDLKKRGKLLYGQDLIKEINPPRLGRLDLVMVFLKLLVVLVVTPVISSSSLIFRIRCFKVLGHLQQVLSYFTHTQTKQDLLEKFASYRFKPLDYPRNNLELYIFTWGAFLKSFLL